VHETPCASAAPVFLIWLSRIARLAYVPPAPATPSWAFLTNHARVLLCVADDPQMRLRDIGAQIGITERAAHRIVRELADAGYVSCERRGRRNRYTVNAHMPVPDALARRHSVGQLLGVLSGDQDFQ
jgi:hypothetical protein